MVRGEICSWLNILDTSNTLLFDCLTETSAYLSRRASWNRQYDPVDVALRDVLLKTGLNLVGDFSTTTVIGSLSLAVVLVHRIIVPICVNSVQIVSRDSSVVGL